MRVDLPAPFSPSRQWIRPGTMSRSMWSLAVRVPNRLVTPRSDRPDSSGGWEASCSEDARLSSVAVDTRSSFHVRAAVVPPGGRVSRGPVPRASGWLGIDHFRGWAAETILILPEAMSFSTVFSSFLTSAGTLESKLWKSDRPVPLSAREPM